MYVCRVGAGLGSVFWDLIVEVGTCMLLLFVSEQYMSMIPCVHRVCL